MKTGFNNIKNFSLIRPGYMVAIFIVIVLLMIISSYIELRETKSEIYNMLDDYANSLIYLVDKSSSNAVISDQEMENLLSVHLLGVARNIKRVDSLVPLTVSQLKSIAGENEIYRINVYNSKAEKIYSNLESDSVHINQDVRHSPFEFISPILKGEQSEIIIGLKEARFEPGSRYAVAVKRASNRKGGAIVVNLDAKSFEEFRKKIGFGKMIQDIGSQSGIEYILLQNEKEIVAANKSVEGISDFLNDDFLVHSMDTDISHTRIYNFRGKDVYEVVNPFVLEGEKEGIFRIGLTMDEVASAESRMVTRAIIISFVLIVVSVILIGGIVTGQNYRLISGEYNKIQTFTGEILQNILLAVIATDKNGQIKIFNKSAERLFNLSPDEVLDRNISGILKDKPELQKLISENELITNCDFSADIPGLGFKILTINKTVIYDSAGVPDTYIIHIRDITEIKETERRNQLNEKLIAMGELASAVAHEIRNPMNSINMIAQRFNKEDKIITNTEEFRNLSDFLQSESRRVNNIIEEFLRFARPPKLNITKVSSDDFMNNMKIIGEVLAKQKSINFRMRSGENTMLKIDTEFMKQMFVNLIQNAIDATSEGGKMEIGFMVKKGKNVFEVSDNGSGIPEENLDKIFNLYFTTKSTGTGLGLSLVQQIVIQHHGTIFVESKEGKGTKFIIELPVT